MMKKKTLPVLSDEKGVLTSKTLQKEKGISVSNITKGSSNRQYNQGPNYDITQEFLDILVQTLPDKPYHSNNLQYGLRIAPKDIAIDARYIQINPPHTVFWLIFDLDYEDSYFLLRYERSWEDIPLPNLMVADKDSGRSHAFYLLQCPVHLKHGKHQASPKPILYLEYVYKGLAALLDADLQYRQLIAKNPASTAWHTFGIHTFTHRLDVLEESIQNSPPVTSRTNPNPLGRNCDLFDRLRYWAYKRLRDPNQARQSEDEWHTEVLRKAVELNEYNVPLPHREIKATAKSVAGWTLKNIPTVSFNRWCLKQQGKSLEKRRTKSKERKCKAIAMAEENISSKEIARSLQISTRQVRRYLQNEKTPIKSQHKGGADICISDDSP